MNRTGHSLLSVVIPSFNEELVIRETHQRLISALERIPKVGLELVYVDDGSEDTTLDILRDIQGADDRVRIVALSRNFGHQVALTAGMEHARGDIDADLQDPPEVIVGMVGRWRAGADVAYGVRSARQGEGAVQTRIQPRVLSPDEPPVRGARSIGYGRLPADGP